MINFARILLLICNVTITQFLIYLNYISYTFCSNSTNHLSGCCSMNNSNASYNINHCVQFQHDDITEFLKDHNVENMSESCNTCMLNIELLEEHIKILHDYELPELSLNDIDSVLGFYESKYDTNTDDNILTHNGIDKNTYYTKKYVEDDTLPNKHVVYSSSSHVKQKNNFWNNSYHTSSKLPSDGVSLTKMSYLKSEYLIKLLSLNNHNIATYIYNSIKIMDSYKGCPEYIVQLFNIGNMTNTFNVADYNNFMCLSLKERIIKIYVIISELHYKFNNIVFCPKDLDMHLGKCGIKNNDISKIYAYYILYELNIIEKCAKEKYSVLYKFKQHFYDVNYSKFFYKPNKLIKIIYHYCVQHNRRDFTLADISEYFMRECHLPSLFIKNALDKVTEENICEFGYTIIILAMNTYCLCNASSCK